MSNVECRKIVKEKALESWTSSWVPSAPIWLLPGGERKLKEKCSQIWVRTKFTSEVPTRPSAEPGNESRPLISQGAVSYYTNIFLERCTVFMWKNFVQSSYFAFLQNNASAHSPKRLWPILEHPLPFITATARERPESSPLNVVTKVYSGVRESLHELSLIHIWRCRRYSLCRSRWSPYH